jgi:peptidoglycan/xylan/chitin deacetylase (PgdA/CDA1 family)
MNIYHPPQWLRKLYPSVQWNVETADKTIYLTFDDGPTPEVTDWVIDMLDKYNAKATFFCIGRNVDRFPDIFKKIILKGHSVGNHTYSHLNGWRCSVQEYAEDVSLASQHIPGKLFRPAYGRISSKQIKVLKAQGYHLVLWDVLSEDYNQHNSPKRCFNFVKKYSSPGAIIVFHDSEKAKKNLYGALPLVLEHFSKLGYNFKALD